jgi:formate dehydrogenase subunit gamma
MADNRKVSDDERESLIECLAEDILKQATSLTEPDVDDPKIEEMARVIKERLSFEAGVLLSEAVTKLSPGRLYERLKDVPQRTFKRFGVNFRLQHMLMFVSVVVLIITGMPLKFPGLGISKFIIVDIFGGLEDSTLIHRIGAVGLIIVGIWHLFYSLFSRLGRRDFFLMIPRPRDIGDFLKTVLFFIGRRPAGPQFGRFSFIEKFDYWAVYWGMVIMIGSGIIMWFKEWFPKYLYDIGREAHSDEGLLATLAIVIWHFYNVHLNPDVVPMSWVWWHGNLSEDEMKHHHPLEYAEIVEAESREIIEEKKQMKDTGSSST